MASVAVRCDGLAADAAALAEARDILSPDERSRAERFRFDRDRRRFMMRRAIARRVLGGIVDVPPQALDFVENDYGKPVLVGGPCFSLSHSADLMMIAVADRPVGCDIERIDPSIDWREIASGLFGAGELRALEALPEHAARRAFFDCWARKEAFVKALGLGLSYPLSAFTVSVAGPARLLSGGAGWAMSVPPAPASHAAAVAAVDDGAPLVITYIAPARSVPIAA